METINESHLSTSEVKKLVKFVTKFTEYNNMAYLHIVSAKPDSKDARLRAGENLVAGGYAWKWNPTPLHNPAVSKINIEVFQDVSYPIVSEYRKRVGKVELLNWKEEFIFVLAHELKHINQFWNLQGVPKHYEVDAEKHAVKVLEKYRELNG